MTLSSYENLIQPCSRPGIQHAADIYPVTALRRKSQYTGDALPEWFIL